MGYNESMIEGRNAVIEAFRSGKCVDKVYVLDQCQDGPILTIKREAKKAGSLIKYVDKQLLDNMSETGKHQGVIAVTAAYDYAEVSDILDIAEERNEDPFIVLLDNIEDPHNLGAVLRTADAAGADGVIFKKTHNASLTPTVAKVSAGAIDTVKCAAVTNLTRTAQELKKHGYWIVGADMDGVDYRTLNYDFNTVLIIGNEGKGISRLLSEQCDYIVSLPMRGTIQSLNASVSAGILMYGIDAARHPVK